MVGTGTQTVPYRTVHPRGYLTAHTALCTSLLIRRVIDAVMGHVSLAFYAKGKILFVGVAE